MSEKERGYIWCDELPEDPEAFRLEDEVEKRRRLRKALGLPDDDAATRGD